MILNQQKRLRTSLGSSTIVDGLHIVITQANRFGAAVNSNILIAHAMTALSKPIVGELGGESYGSSLSSKVSARSDPKFKALMPCLGTGGKTLVVSGAQTGRAGLFTGGTDRNTVVGTDSESSASGRLTATIQNASLLRGLLTAGQVIAKVHVLKRDGFARFDDIGSSFIGLSMPGHQFGSTVPSNTVIRIPGLGTLYLHRVLRAPTSIEVRMIELVVTHSNAFGIPVGSDLRMGVASVSIK